MKKKIKVRNVKNFKAVLKKRSACASGLEWVEKRDRKQALKDCKNICWLYWELLSFGHYEELHNCIYALEKKHRVDISCSFLSTKKRDYCEDEIDQIQNKPWYKTLLKNFKKIIHDNIEFVESKRKKIR